MRSVAEVGLAPGIADGVDAVASRERADLRVRQVDVLRPELRQLIHAGVAQVRGDALIEAGRGSRADRTVRCALVRDFDLRAVSAHGIALVQVRAPFGKRGRRRVVVAVAWRIAADERSKPPADDHQFAETLRATAKQRGRHERHERQ